MMPSAAHVMPDLELLLRLFLALLLGAAIGFERRWRGHAAGPHTNGLVAVGAALFVILAGKLGGDAASRITAQVPTGIGFLAGGVILRDGLRVRGLNTAATIWCVAAIGCISGFGGYALAIGATALTVVANSFFHFLEHNVTRLRHVSEGDGRHERRRSDSS
jgi:putative Mg2+ transporter-C (MgtC) family protein